MAFNAEAGFSTRAIHQGYQPTDSNGAVCPPVYLSSTYSFPTADSGGARFEGAEPGFIYGRLGSPTTQLLESRLASLEGAEASLVTASGMGAITSLLWTLLKPGDEILVDETVYGCTFSFLHHGLAKFGVKVRHVDMMCPSCFEKLIGPHTRGIYFETPANPNMRVIDIEAIAGIANRKGLWSVVDGTYTTPYLQRPIELGATFVVHSATKYLSGHGDLLAGVVSGPKDKIDEVRMCGLKDMTGSVLSGFDAHLLLRGIKTLELRMERHCSTALRIAQTLLTHPKVERVYYPGLKNNPSYDTARKQMKAFGGMIALELKGGMLAGKAFLDNLNLVTRAVSLGDCESLAQHPASMTHSTYTKEERELHGISEGLVRLSVGLECPDDIERDILRALEAA